jgi:multiple sugar transport system ATP-binding protein
VFVAGFTGSPPMNLAACTLGADGHVDLGGLRVRLPPALGGRINGATSLTFGVRPENLSLAPTGDDDIALPAEVSLLEPLGAETLVTLQIGGSDMVARCSAAFREPPGTRLTVHMRPRHLHLFDTATGTAL